MVTRFFGLYASLDTLHACNRLIRQFHPPAE
jgi:hypothetical protein